MKLAGQLIFDKNFSHKQNGGNDNTGLKEHDRSKNEND